VLSSVRRKLKAHLAGRPGAEVAALRKGGEVRSARVLGLKYGCFLMSVTHPLVQHITMLVKCPGLDSTCLSTCCMRCPLMRSRH
jgi:hypothetical protein